MGMKYCGECGVKPFLPLSIQILSKITQLKWYSQSGVFTANVKRGWIGILGITTLLKPSTDLMPQKDNLGLRKTPWCSQIHLPSDQAAGWDLNQVLTPSWVLLHTDSKISFWWHVVSILFLLKFPNSETCNISSLEKKKKHDRTIFIFKATKGINYKDNNAKDYEYPEILPDF